MRVILVSFLTMLVSVSMAGAERKLSASEFDELSQNKTLYFNQSGQFYGVEQYFPNRLVTWKDISGECQNGYWHEENGSICFTYETEPTQCWHVLERQGNIYARMTNWDGRADLELNYVDTSDLECPAPFLGS